MLLFCQDSLIQFENQGFMLKKVIRYKKMEDGSKPNIDALHVTPLL
jgi:hypothetical protein